MGKYGLKFLQPIYPLTEGVLSKKQLCSQGKTRSRISFQGLLSYQRKVTFVLPCVIDEKKKEVPRLRHLK